jgi:hypothetical protein
VLGGMRHALEGIEWRMLLCADSRFRNISFDGLNESDIADVGTCQSWTISETK